MNAWTRCTHAGHALPIIIPSSEQISASPSRAPEFKFSGAARYFTFKCHAQSDQRRALSEFVNLHIYIFCFPNCQHVNVQILKFHDLQIHRCVDFPNCIFQILSLCKFASFPICKDAGFQICRLLHLPNYKLRAPTATSSAFPFSAGIESITNWVSQFQ